MAWHNMPNTIDAKFGKSDRAFPSNKAIVGSIAVIAEFR
jgi:hypothetical protein